MNEEQYVGALRRCSLHTLLMLVSKVLTRSGFGDVQILDRRQSGQRSRFGGHELVCMANIGTLPAKIAVKVVQQDVRVRMLDELAGAVVRTGADMGLIVTPHEITGTAEKQQGSHARARVDVIDGRDLARLLIRHGIGVGDNGKPDREFFGGLETASRKLLGFIREAKR